MRNLTIGIATVVIPLFAGVLAWNAEATPLTGTVMQPGVNYSLVERAGCWLPGLPGECELGQQKVCNRFGNRCHCKPCPGWYPWRPYRPAH